MYTPRGNNLVAKLLEDRGGVEELTNIPVLGLILVKLEVVTARRRICGKIYLKQALQ